MEFNPLDKKNEICKLLDDRELKYELHTSKDEGYNYLEYDDICITVNNPYYEEKLYIDLIENAELIVSFNYWHAHYCNYDEDYKMFIDDLNGIFDNEKCALIINSTDRWLSSSIINSSEEKLYKQEIESLPEEFKNELKSIHGNVNFYYWNNINNKEINV